MATIEEIEVDKVFRHKGGKLYKICNDYLNHSAPRWGRQRDERGIYSWDGPLDKSRVWCVQWQINEKHPEGREYQADRELKIEDLTAI